YQAGDLIEERRAALGAWAELIHDAHRGRIAESRALPPLIRNSWLGSPPLAVADTGSPPQPSPARSFRQPAGCAA
ncbi:MAG TPA: hypothetical protein VFA75_05320, partial [Nevskia sp.]|nr:hypothetical protein [Nevskia sp.]